MPQTGKWTKLQIFIGDCIQYSLTVKRKGLRQYVFWAL